MIKYLFNGDTMKKQYLIYADESHRNGKYFSNFYSGALFNYTELEKINNKEVKELEWEMAALRKVSSNVLMS